MNLKKDKQKTLNFSTIFDFLVKSLEPITDVCCISNAYDWLQLQTVLDDNRKRNSPKTTTPKHIPKMTAEKRHSFGAASTITAIEGIPMEDEESTIAELMDAYKKLMTDSESWKLAVEQPEEHMKIWCKQGSKNMCIRSEILVPCSADKAVQYLRQPTGVSEWDVTFAKSKEVQCRELGRSGRLFYAFFVTHPQWPLAARECYTVHTEVGEADGTKLILTKSLPTLPLRDKKHAQLSVLNATYAIAPIKDGDGNSCLVTRISEFNLNASFVPSAVLNKIITSFAPTSLKQLQKILSQL